MSTCYYWRSILKSASRYSGHPVWKTDKECQVKMPNARSPIVIHYVNDMKRSITFYRTVFNVDPSFESPGWTTLDFHAFELALHILSPQEHDEAVIPHAGLNLLVDNIEQMQIAIESVGGRLVELREPSGGVPVRVASFKDSEGNGFELRQEPSA